MIISLDLLAVIVTRIAILGVMGTYLFRQWLHVPRRYVSDLPFLMGVSFRGTSRNKGV